MRNNVTTKQALDALKNAVMDYAIVIAWQGTWINANDRWLAPLGRREISPLMLRKRILEANLDALIQKINPTTSLDGLVDSNASDWKTPDHFIGKHLQYPEKGNGDDAYTDVNGYIENLFLAVLQGKLTNIVKPILKKIEEKQGHWFHDERWIPRTYEPQLKKVAITAHQAREALEITLPKKESFSKKLAHCCFFFRKQQIHIHLENLSPIVIPKFDFKISAVTDETAFKFGDITTKLSAPQCAASASSFEPTEALEKYVLEQVKVANGSHSLDPKTSLLVNENRYLPKERSESPDPLPRWIR